MPPWNEESPLATAVGAAAGFLQSSQDAKLRAQQAASEKQRQDEADRQNAVAQTALQHHYATQDAAEAAKEAEAKRRQDAADRKAGVGLSNVPDFTPKPVKGANPNDPLPHATALLARADWYDKNGAYDAANEDRKNAAAIMAAFKTQAQTTDTAAHTTLLGSESWNLRYEKPKEFAQKLAATEKANRDALGAKYAIAKERVDAEISRRLSGGRGGARGGSGRSGEMAQMALQRMVAGENYRAAVDNVMNQYHQDESNYRQETSENERNQQFNMMNPNGPQMPIINVQQPSVPQMPMVVIRDGQPVVVQPPAPRQQPRPNAAPARGAAPAPQAAPPAAQGGNWWDGIAHNVQHLFGGGQPAAPANPPVMHNGKMYYKHADGNYYLTP